MGNRWRRFRPVIRGNIDDPTVYEPDSIYGQARQIVDESIKASRRKFGRRRDVHKDTSEAIKYLKDHNPQDPQHLLALLILQAPNAARAQAEMDTHRGGYRNRTARLYELIDFNDMFVDTVLSLDDEVLADFTTRLKDEIDRFCSIMHAKSLNDRQYEAIVHGLSREIAVYRAAKAIGYTVRMTSRAQDAMGVDMVIFDKQNKKSLNIDVKTHSAFHFRLIELQKQDRLDEEKRLQCELAGFCEMKNGHGDGAVNTVLLRIATDRLGEIRNFDFVELAPIADLISSALKHEGRYLAV